MVRTVSHRHLARRASQHGNLIEDLLETCRILLPGKRVTPLIFANTPEGDNLEALNAYVAEIHAADRRPHADLQRYRRGGRRNWRGRYRQAASSAQRATSPSHPPTFRPTRSTSSILPPHQLEVHNRYGWVVMLHLPCDGRLRDGVNLAQLRRIEHDYPNLSLIVAHVDGLLQGGRGRRFRGARGHGTHLLRYQRQYERLGLRAIPPPVVPNVCSSGPTCPFCACACGASRGTGTT